MKTPILETQRLLLRPLSLADAEYIFDTWTSDSEVARFMSWTPHQNVEETIEWLKTVEENEQSDTVYDWGLELKGTGKLVGAAGLYHKEEVGVLELGYVLCRPCWGQGLMTEAAKRIVQFARDDLHQTLLFCQHANENPASGRVMEHAGFRYWCDSSYTSFDGLRTFPCRRYLLALNAPEYPALLTASLYKQAEAFMLSCMKDSAHDCEHVRRVLYTALGLAEAYPEANRTVLILACLLHDIARQEQLEDPRLCHAAEGGKKAYRWLLENGMDEPSAAAVRACIQTHRFRSDNPPQSIEAKLLFDADKLEAAGAIGIARTLLYQGSTGSPLYNLDEAGNVLDGSTDTSASFFREYRRKLQGLYGKFYTEQAAVLAAERRESAEAFYQELLCEVTEGLAPGRNAFAVFLEKHP